MRMANLWTISKEDYLRLHKSGMFWELFPDAVGRYEEDMKLAEDDYKKVTK